MKNVKKYISGIFFFFCLGIFVYEVANSTIRGYVLTDKSPKVKAFIINEKNYFGNTPVSHEFSYSYSFKIDDKIYKGDSMESKFNVGDSIIVRYLKSNPSLNESVSYFPK